jgi:hypothetical protein
MKALVGLLAACVVFFASVRSASAQVVFSFGSGLFRVRRLLRLSWLRVLQLLPELLRLRLGRLLSALVAASVLRRVLWSPGPAPRLGGDYVPIALDNGPLNAVVPAEGLVPL